MRWRQAVSLALIALWSAGLGAWGASAVSAADWAIKSRVVQLLGDGYCTGEQIVAPSGKTFVLTAGHCADIALAGVIKAITEDGRTFYLEVIAESPYSDVLLLEGIPGLNGLHLGTATKPDERVRTFGRGKQPKAYVGEGSVGADEEIRVPMFPIENIEDAKNCTGKPKFHMSATIYGPACIMKAVQGTTSALVILGSSGGPVVNDSGEVVGVMSAYFPHEYGTFVPPQQIHEFLSAY